VRRRRRPASVGRVVSTVVLALGLAACLPSPMTTQAEDISDLYAVFLGAGIVVGLIVWILATAAILRGRRRRPGEPAQSHGNARVEALWTLVPLITVLVLFGLTIRTLAVVDAQGSGGVNLDVTAFRWQWQAVYPDAGVRLVGTADEPLEVVLPVGTPVHVTLTSIDVNHALYVPAFLFKRDAIPGQPTSFDLQVTAPGVYPGACAEFCGVGHAQMPFTIRGVDQATFDAWLAAQAAGVEPSGSASP
jgi:cytochrome c oxidase subunit II